MAELITKLGIDWKLLIANSITFGIVLWVLWKFAYRPIIALLEKRQQQVADSLASVKKIEADRETMAKERAETLAATKAEARQLIQSAEEQAAVAHRQQLEKTQVEAAALVKHTKEQLQREQAAMLDEAKGQIAGLVVTATAKIMSERLTPEKEAELEKKAVQALKETVK